MKKDRGLSVTGWGFQSGEAVVFTLFTSGAAGVIVAGGEADEVGILSVKTGRRTRLDRLGGLEAGVGYLLGEGGAGTKASCMVNFVDKAK